MVEPTRLLGAYPCPKCGKTLLLASAEERERSCPFCDEPTKAPKRLVDDLELGRKLPMDAAGDVQKAIDEHVEAGHVGPEARSWLVLLLVVVAAGLGAYAEASSELEPTAGDWALGALLGLVMVVLPFGFTLQWLSTSELARGVARATATLRGRPRACPRCQTAVMAHESPGTFDCPECKASLVTAGGLVIVDQKPRSSRWTEAVAGALKDEGATTRHRMRTSQRLLLTFVAITCLTATWFVLSAA